jgi:hypothetical protein
MEVKEKADKWKDYLLKQFNEHRFALYEEWDNSCTEDQYGNLDSDFSIIKNLMMLYYLT